MEKLILVVEDEAEIRRDLVITLKFSGYEAYGAKNGVEGLELAKKYKPQLIISDIMMPELDGYGLLAELQKDPDLTTIPFLFLSAKSDVREGMNFGADDFITKPYDIDELLEAIEARLKKSEVSEIRFLKKFEELSSRISRSLPHEIRTPLGMILGYSDFLLKNFDSTKPAEAKEMLENMYEAGRRLNRLFENHLFYAKLETIAASDFDLERLRKGKTISASIFIEDIILYFAVATNRNADLDIDLVDGEIAISEKYLIKIIEEVFDNAVKFSKMGSTIKVKSTIVGDYYRFSISDSGRGMSKEDANSIGAYIQFERQVYEQQGSGLGMAIVKKIMELHNGKVSIDSAPDRFTTVTLDIPIVKKTD